MSHTDETSDAEAITEALWAIEAVLDRIARAVELDEGKRYWGSTEWWPWAKPAETPSREWSSTGTSAPARSRDPKPRVVEYRHVRACPLTVLEELGAKGWTPATISGPFGSTYTALLWRFKPEDPA